MTAEELMRYVRFMRRISKEVPRSMMTPGFRHQVEKYADGGSSIVRGS